MLATKDNSDSASHSDDEEEDQTDEDQNSENHFQNSKDPQLISSCSSKVVLPKLFFVCLPSLLIMLFGSPFSAKSSETTAETTAGATAGATSETTAETTAVTALKTNFNFGLLFIQDLGKLQKMKKTVLTFHLLQNKKKLRINQLEIKITLLFVYFRETCFE